MKLGFDSKTNSCTNSLVYLGSCDDSVALVDLVTQLIEKGGSTTTRSWSYLTKPLQVQGKETLHIVGTKVGEIYANFVNGISIKRNRRSGWLEVIVYTHWMGCVDIEFELTIQMGAFVSSRVNRFAWGMQECTETDAISYMKGLLLSMDNQFTWTT